MQPTLIDTNKILYHLGAIQKQLDELQNSKISDEWIPKKAFMNFMGYGETQMAALLKDRRLRVKTIGKRKFIYKPSIAAFLNQND